MNTKVLTTLEYNKIIDLLTEKADSEPGKKLCRDLVPSTDLSTIRTAQRETKDALARLFRIGSTSFGSNRDLGFSIRSLEIGSSLSISELLKYQDLTGKLTKVWVQLGADTAFEVPELLSISDEQMEAYYEAEPALNLYRRHFDSIRRKRAHILSESEEKLLAMAGEMAGTPEDIR